jgi:ribosomal protection tetracycline resistance protein
MPLYLFKNAQAFTAAIERHVRNALEHGLHGWRVTDALVTLTEVAYSVADGPPSRRGPTSTAYDYRQGHARRGRRGAPAGRYPRL